MNTIRTSYLFFFMYGASRPRRLTTLLPCTGTISVNRALVRFERRRRKWLLPPFERTSFPDPVMRNRLDVALWVFSLYFPAFCFCGTVNLLFTKLCGLLKAALQTIVIVQWSGIVPECSISVNRCPGIIFCFLSSAKASSSSHALPYWAFAQQRILLPIPVQFLSSLPMPIQGR